MKRYCKNCKHWDAWFGTKNDGTKNDGTKNDGTKTEAYCFKLQFFTHALSSCSEHRFTGDIINLTPYV